MVLRRSDWLRYLALSIGVLVSAFAIAVLIAWQVHFIPLIQVSPRWVPMQRMTALAFVLCGISLLLLGTAGKRAARLFVLAVSSITALVVLEYGLDVDLGIDQLLGSDYVRVRTSSPGRMSPVTALCFLAISVALLALSKRKPSRYAPAIAGILGSVVAATGAIGVFAYVLGNNEAYGWGRFTRVAVHTAAGMVIIGAGALLLAWRETSASQVSPRWLPLSIGLGLTAGTLGVWQALTVHEESQFPLLSQLILGGGIAGALLVAIAVYQAQKATLRSRELQEGKAAFERLFEASLDALLVVDREGRIVGLNERTASVFGYMREELLERPIASLVPEIKHDLHRAFRQRYFSSPSRRPMGDGLELYAQRKDGSEFPVEVALSPLASGGDLQVLAAVRDITERKQAQEALRLSEARFRGVFENSPLGLALIQPDYRLAKVNASLCRMSGYSEAELMGMNPFDFTHPDDLEMSKAPAERLFKGEIPFYQVEKRYVKKSGEIMWATMTATILRDREGRPLFGLGMIEDITARKQAQEALRQSEEQFRGVFEQGPIGITLIGKDYRLMKVNQAFCRMLGYSEEELTRMTPLDVSHPDDRALTLDRVERLFHDATPSQNIEKRYLTKSGEVVWGNLNASVIHDREGKLLYGMGMIEDITERKRAEEELRTLSQRLSQAVRFASMSVWEWDPRTNCFVWDETAFEMAGIPRTVPLLYEQFAQVVHPEDLPRTEAALRRVVLERTQESVEFRVVRPDGELRHAYAAGGPILDQQGNVTRVVGIAVDITERKRTEAQLRSLSERLSLATRIASIGVWDYDLRTNQAVWDDASFEMFGLPKVNPVPYAEFVAHIHPDDVAKVEALTERVARRKAQEALEFRIIRSDGSERFLSVAAGGATDEHGNVVRVVGIAIDVTERKRAEEELRVLTQRLSLAARSASMGVWELNPGAGVAIWDDRMFEIFGIAKKAGVGREDWASLVHPDDLAKGDAFVDTIVRGKTQDTMEFRIIRPDGSLRYVSSTGGAALDAGGNVTGVVGIAIDITERKQLEQDLEAAREQAITSARLSALGMMAGGIAHEINNPLSIIHAMASDLKEMVAEDGSAPPQVVARKSAVIRETAQRIARIVKSLRQISREGSSDLFHPTPVAKILAETLEICRAKFKANSVELLLPQAIPGLSVPCREVQIAQALLNLLQNAFDAALEGEGERWVRLEVEPRDGVVAISVVDSGPGIPPELRSRVMEPFFTTKPVGKGTGLGLSLSKTIAEDHGGKLEYGEDCGHTRFSLILPLARKAEAA